MEYDDSETSKDEVNEQDNESSNESEQPEEFKSEIQIPDNIDINLDETPSEEGESSVSENTEASEENAEEGEQDLSEFENFVPSSRFNSRATVNSFLEQEAIEPIGNLERDLQNVNTNTQTNQTELQNAPQYSSSSGDYTGKSYYEKPTDDTYPKMIGSGPSGLSSPINPNEAIGWRNPENSNQEDSGYPGEQYRFASSTSEPVKKRRDIL